MTKTRLMLGIASLGCLAAGVALYASLGRSAISREAAARIEQGMSLADVEALLGGPPRDESTGPLTADRADDGQVADQEMFVWSFMGANPWFYHGSRPE